MVAVVRVKVTVNDLLCPRRSVSVDGWTLTLKPGRPVVVAVYVAEPGPTFVTVRVTVCEPARSPIVIDARFRSLGSSEYPAPASASQASGLMPAVAPHRKAIQSLKPES